jgi:hypothetical protein
VETQAKKRYVDYYRRIKEKKEVENGAEMLMSVRGRNADPLVDEINKEGGNGDEMIVDSTGEGGVGSIEDFNEKEKDKGLETDEE